MSNAVFVLIDGDNVGEKIDLLVLQDDLRGLADFTAGIDQAVDRIEALALEAGAAIHMAGGDNVLARLTHLDAFLERFVMMKGEFCCPFSVGIGPEAKDAHVALKVAKAFAPGTIVRARPTDGELRFSRLETLHTWSPLDDRAGPLESKYTSKKKRL